METSRCLHEFQGFAVFARPELECICSGLIFSAWVFDHADENCELFLCVCVCQGDHATVWKELERAALPHLCHRPGGVPVFRRSCVRVGFVGLRPQVRELLQLSVRQHDRSQRNQGLRYALPPEWRAVCCPTSQKCFQNRSAPLVALFFFLSVSQTAAARMSSSPWFSPSLPL